MAHEPTNNGERIAILETEMKTVKEGIEKITTKLDDQTKKLYYALGGVAGVITVVEIALKLSEHSK